MKIEDPLISKLISKQHRPVDLKEKLSRVGVGPVIPAGLACTTFDLRASNLVEHCLQIGFSGPKCSVWHTIVHAIIAGHPNSAREGRDFEGDRCGSALGRQLLRPVQDASIEQEDTPPQGNRHQESAQLPKRPVLIQFKESFLDTHQAKIALPRQ